jgi:hypothetical protein
MSCNINQITYDAELLNKFPVNTYVKWGVWAGVVRGLRVNASNEVVMMIEDCDGDMLTIHPSNLEAL